VDAGGAPPLGDAQVVQGLADGHAWAASLAWERYGPMVYRLFSRALGGASECDDLTQDVFLVAFTAIGRLRDPDAFRSFIYACALRRLRSHLRRKRVLSFFPLFSPEQLPDPPVQAADDEGREALARFYRTLEKLDANERTAYVLRHLEGLSLVQVASATGASLATVKRRLARAAERVARYAKEDSVLTRYVVPEGADEGR
jgi:RNA polymerase sigma-70 factor (ECF subfamily)